METTAEFMERFRATGLDMLCEARRREEQFYWRWSPPITRSWSAAGPSWQQIPKARSMFHDMWEKSRSQPPGPGWRFIDFDTDAALSETTVTGRIRTVRPEGPPVRIIGPYAEGLEPRRERVIIKDRSVGVSYHKQAMAAAIAMASLTASGREMGDRLIELGDSFGTAAQSLDEWVASFSVGGARRSARIYPEGLPKPSGQSLGPGKEVEAPGPRRVDAKRLAKDRLKKKLAKKSRK